MTATPTSTRTGIYNYREQRALRNVRAKYPNMPQREIARRITSGTIADVLLVEEIVSTGLRYRTFASVYAHVRRYDAKRSPVKTQPVGMGF